MQNSERFSRRELFLKFSPSRNVSEMSKVGEIQPSYLLSRRQLMTFVGALGATLVVSHYLGRNVEAKQNEDQNSSQGAYGTEMSPSKKGGELNQGNRQELQPENNKEDETPFTKTAFESSLFTAAELISVPILKALKLPVGKASSKEMNKFLKDKPFMFLLLVAGVVPPIEEALFRLIPSTAVGGDGLQWKVGIPVSAIFAGAHSLKLERDRWGDLEMLEKEIPIYQFASGLFYWYMMRTRGYNHATLAHSTTNTIAISVGRLLYEAFPGSSVPNEPIGSEFSKTRRPQL